MTVTIRAGRSALAVDGDEGLAVGGTHAGGEGQGGVAGAGGVAAVGEGAKEVPVVGVDGACGAPFGWAARGPGSRGRAWVVRAAAGFGLGFASLRLSSDRDVFPVRRVECEAASINEPRRAWPCAERNATLRTAIFDGPLGAVLEKMLHREEGTAQPKSIMAQPVCGTMPAEAERVQAPPLQIPRQFPRAKRCPSSARIGRRVPAERQTFAPTRDTHVEGDRA